MYCMCDTSMLFCQLTLLGASMNEMNYQRMNEHLKMLKIHTSSARCRTVPRHQRHQRHHQHYCFNGKDMLHFKHKSKYRASTSVKSR